MTSNKNDNSTKLKKENLKALFKNTRSRIIILFTAILLLIAVIIGLIKFGSSTVFNLNNESGVHRVPGIRSIPGALNPTAEYAQLQEEQNVTQAKQALQTGSSAIPTIIRSRAFGEGVESVGAKHGEGSVGFQTLAQLEQGGPQNSLWLQTLRDKNCSKASIAEVKRQGATLNDLKQACSCAKLKDSGYSIQDLKNICTCPNLRGAGFNIEEMKQVGFSAKKLRECGFVACEERAAGFSAQEMKDAGFSEGELKGAGFSDQDIARASGLPDGMMPDDVLQAGDNPEALARLRQAGVTAAALRRIKGVGAAQLKAAGFNADELRQAGFTAAELKNAGFTPAQLKQAGYSARDLLNAGLTPEELAAAGFSADEIKAAQDELPNNMTANDVKNAGCSEEILKRERLAGVSASAIRQYANCSPQALKAAGLTATELKNAGLTPAELRQAGLSPRDLLNAGITPEELAAAGFSADEIKAAQDKLPDNITANDVKNAGCSEGALKRERLAGVSASAIRKYANCSLQALKAAGFTPAELRRAGFGARDLLNARWTPAALLAAGLTPDEIAAAEQTNCSVSSLRAAHATGVSAETIRNKLGCSAQALKSAGYSTIDLKNAGFTPAELKKAGFSNLDLKTAGFDARALRAAGLSAAELKSLGFKAETLSDAGFSPEELRQAGFTAEQLKRAGLTPAQLKVAGFSLAELQQAGLSARDLKNAGFSANQLRNAGISSQDLVAAGFTSQESSLAGLEAIEKPAPMPSTVASVPSIGGATTPAAANVAENTQQLNQILNRQQKEMAEQRYQQKIQQRKTEMLSAASQLIQGWKAVPVQQYQESSIKEEQLAVARVEQGHEVAALRGLNPEQAIAAEKSALIKTGDILFAVIDTSINSDEPGPILATIVSGKLKGAKLIGSFNLPGNADKMVISFNTLSVPGAAKTASISAFAIDPNTARTALSSQTDHHYLERYGSLFAATFLEGFGNAFQSADTTITVGGTGDVANTTVQNGIGRSALENAVIGLATVGKAWGQVAQQNMSRPTTVQVHSGTGVGVLFTQDLAAL